MATNCVFPGCSVQRTEKYKNVKLFGVPKRKDEFYTRWRKNLLDTVSLYRVIDSDTKRKIMECETTICICERHFSPDDIEITKNGKKNIEITSVTNYQPAKQIT